MSIFIPSKPSSDSSFSLDILAINQKNIQQDGEISLIKIEDINQDGKISLLELRMTGAETVNSNQDIKITSLEVSMTGTIAGLSGAITTNTAQDIQITALESDSYLRYVEGEPVNKRAKDSFLDEVNNIYHTTDAIFPQLNPLPTNYTGTVHSVSTEAELNTALTNAMDFDVISISNGMTFTSTKNLGTKKLKIMGAVPNINLVFNTTTGFFSCTNSDVWIDNLGFENLNLTAGARLLVFNNINGIGTFVTNCRFLCNRTAIITNYKNIQITGCNFRYIGTPVSHAYIRLIGCTGQLFVCNNDFEGNTTLSTRLMENAGILGFSSSYIGGSIIMSRNISVINPVSRLYAGSFTSTNTNFKLYVSHNSITTDNDGFISWSTTILLNGFSEIYLVNNIHNSIGGSGRGIFFLDPPVFTTMNVFPKIYSGGNSYPLQLLQNLTDLTNPIANQPALLCYDTSRLFPTQLYDLIVPKAGNITSKLTTDVTALQTTINSATSSNVANTLVLRDANGKSSFGALETNSLESVSGGTLSIGTANTTTTLNLGCGTGIQTVNIGIGVGATQINLGGPGDTVTVAGTLTTINTTNLEVEDKLIKLNKNNGPNSGFSSGIEIDENNVVTGYIKTSSDRNSWICKAPNGVEFNLGSSSTGVIDPTPNTLVLRDASANIQARLFNARLPDLSFGEYATSYIYSSALTYRLFHRPSGFPSGDLDMIFSEENRGVELSNRKGDCNIKMSSTDPATAISKSAKIILETRNSEKYNVNNTTEFHFLDNNNVKVLRLGANETNFNCPVTVNAIASNGLVVSGLTFTPVETTFTWMIMEGVLNGYGITCTVSLRKIAKTVYFVISPPSENRLALYNDSFVGNYQEHIPIAFRNSNLPMYIPIFLIKGSERYAGSFSISTVNPGSIVLELVNQQLFSSVLICTWTEITGSYVVPF